MTQPKTAIVTGAGRGIGKAICLRLATLGYNLTLAARTVEQLEDTASECREFGIDTLSCKTDVSDEAQVIHMFSNSLNRYERIDLLINNAGVGVFKKIEDTTLDEWNQVLETNLTGAFICSREAFKHMKEAGGGQIINISSVVGIKGYPNQGAYTASKHGVNGLTKVLAEEGREFNIRAHVICPGGVATDMVKNARPDINAAELIQPDDVADLVEYFITLPLRVSVDMVHLRRFSGSSF